MSDNLPEKGIKIVITKPFGNEVFQVSTVVDKNDDIKAFADKAYEVVNERATAYAEECAEFDKKVGLGAHNKDKI